MGSAKTPHHALLEEVPRVEGMSTREISALADGVNNLFSAAAKDQPPGLDWCDVAERLLQRYGVLVYPDDFIVSRDGVHALTSFDGVRGDPVEVRIEARLFDSLGEPRNAGPFARSTLAHELGHAILHVNQLRARRATLQRMGMEAAMARIARAEIKPYEDPEWQAYCFAGFLLVPWKSAMRMHTAGATVRDIASAHFVSESFVREVLRKMKVVPTR